MPAQCLLLDASYEPLAPLITLSRAMRLVLAGKAEIVEDEGRTVRAAERELRRPAVLRLVSHVAVPRRHRRGVTNTWLFARDEYRCAYCGRHERELGVREFLTRDHVLPTSRGGTNSWENCVTACRRCNGRKADRTPEEARMPLRADVALVAPHFARLAWPVRRLTALQQQYVALYFGDDVLAALR
ncbi:HNH endonuclease [Gemmatirosa kalamazoonensis]|uniref:HNH endonuclease n=1 Tax=Gemmatirosa kalamazoonensis TaxID=861299 RepID=W0RG95_9BACT|nr:HNH endonuclease [Gemmatirosa kalamazoonensis]AHG88418.1 HNH endonuclease [Gemmatirosa kalamazoonensis]